MVDWKIGQWDPVGSVGHDINETLRNRPKCARELLQSDGTVWAYRDDAYRRGRNSDVCAQSSSLFLSFF